MSFLDYFRSKKEDNSSASLAKERLQIIVAHERTVRKKTQPDYLPKMQREILDVISKYVDVDRDDVNVTVDSTDDCSVLELNVTLPDN